ncbi:MAG: twin-arginine translocation signal domain-containing protein [Alphaproteobacteria bacterium]|nr:twin-arginine translocation signal domain-containing protein [Alphaproteobacteria bacterium]
MYDTATQSSRRSFLQTAAGATALSALPPNLPCALADPLPSGSGTIMHVEHVVILMQENRSFDHYFGTLDGVRGSPTIWIAMGHGSSRSRAKNPRRISCPEKTCTTSAC